MALSTARFTVLYRASDKIIGNIEFTKTESIPHVVLSTTEYLENDFILLWKFQLIEKIS